MRGATIALALALAAPAAAVDDADSMPPLSQAAEQALDYAWDLGHGERVLDVCGEIRTQEAERCVVALADRLHAEAWRDRLLRWRTA